MTALPVPGQAVRHIDGGYYRVLTRARSADDQSPLVVYVHLWPFDTTGDPWVRPLSEWQSRFVAVAEQDVETARRSDRAAAQHAVTAAKAVRRSLTRR
ncbi:DUF1653 domain-containing protein [Aquincola tertiaricarbonis]|uniref:DUF1653 domain-containing protein n=1 Tax=Aquincola tertiaricarbonis TaxID=391953 RepID=UPI0012ECC9F3|nr:DUF1653 domain-containing protein [Aquincola tertiaricarbonis]